jgi:transcriptional regulator with XRE-family HTH domain
VGGTSQTQLYDAFGAYVRSQRKLAQLTLRQAAELASISNPYLSQIEHGLALPSIAVLGALADALSVSAETMLLRAAGIASSNGARRPGQTEESILQDPRLDNNQKHALLAVLASFVGSASDADSAGPVQLASHRDRERPTTRTARPRTVGGAASHRQKGV